MTDIAFTSDFCDNHSHPASPASLFLTSPRPILDVLKSLVSRPQVPSPHTRVPMSPSHFYTQPNNHRPTELHVVSHQSVYDARSTPCPLSILKQGEHKAHFLRAVHIAKSLRFFHQLQRSAGIKRAELTRYKELALSCVNRGIALDSTCMFEAMFIENIGDSGTSFRTK